MAKTFLSSSEYYTWVSSGCPTPAPCGICGKPVETKQGFPLSHKCSGPWLEAYEQDRKEHDKTETRQFATGATRGKDDDKLDFEGFLSPLVLERYSEYMHKCRLRNIPEGQTIRSSDNWQKGMSLESYMKSGFRHFVEWWKSHRGWITSVSTEEALCALLFNVQGYLHELIKSRMNGPTRTHSGIKSERSMSSVSLCQSFDPQI